MAFGIDTLETRLDLIDSNALDTFKRWNGGAPGQGGIVGGDPAFAGRHFLGGDFIWGHAEATNASSEPDGGPAPGANDPSPQHPENLHLSVPLIAPIQAPQPDRQQATGERGVLYGQLDAQAICKTLLACHFSGEYGLPASQLVRVWLAVDSTVMFTADYWAGWSDCVNQYLFHVPVVGNLGFSLQPFQACVLCSYTIGADGLLHPDPNVTAALASRAYPRFRTTSHGFWADAAVGPNANAGLAPNPALNWNSFDHAASPLLWRLKNGFLQPDGSIAHVSFNVDAVNAGAPENPTTFMFTTNQWQPNVASISDIGFIVAQEISAAGSACIQNNDMPDLQDNSNHPSNVKGGRVQVIGRYLKTPGHGSSMNAAEAQRLSDANFYLFTVWESFNDVAGGEPTLDQRYEGDWGPFNANFRKNIHYFNPANHAGTEDGQYAFSYCGETLKQPPQTPIFFAVDFDPLDLPDPSHPHPDPTHPPPGSPPGTPIPPAPGWPALPNAALRKQWIQHYFELVKAARDDYAKSNRDRFYRIGVYGCGVVLQWCYEQGIVSSFWQAVSSGHTGSRPPRWPWYHSNRWQYQFTGDGHGLAWTCANAAPGQAVPIPGPDPDADWGDGGTWNLNDRVASRLTDLEKREIAAIEEQLHKLWGQMIQPGQMNPIHP